MLYNWQKDFIRKGPNNQHAFTKGISTESALSEVINEMEKVKYRGSYTLTVFTDIEGAFDNLSFEGIDQAIDKNIKDARTGGWYKQMLKNR